MNTRLSRRFLAYGLLTPAFAITVGLMFYPLAVALNLSIHEGASMNFGALSKLPLGLGNYRTVLASGATWYSLYRSAVYTLGGTGIAFLIGLATALLLNRRLYARRLQRMLILLPWSIPGVAVSIAFLWMLDASYGIVNYLLWRSGMFPRQIPWFFSPHLAMIGVLLPTIWKGYPFFTITLLAALQSIPSELYEAAKVDGASSTARFMYITWPGIRNSAILALVLNGLWTLNVFDIIFVTTQGGPLQSTETLAISIYNQAFQYFHMGNASALGVVVLVLSAVAVSVVYPQMQKNQR